MAAPAAPTNVKWTRLSDQNMVVSWTVPQGATSVTIQYQKGSASSPWVTGWPKLPGTSYTIRKWNLNSAYRLRLYASNKDGNSLYSSATPWFYTPPAAASNVTAKTALNTAGNPIGVNVGFKLTSFFQSGVEIERSTGGTIVVGSGTGGLVKAPYLDGDVAGKVSYQVRPFAGALGETVAGVQQGRVYGAWSKWTGEVSVARKAPYAPSVVAATGAAAGASIRVPVIHQSSDGSPQSGVRAQYRVQGSGTWTLVTVAGGQAWVDLPAQAVGTIVEVQAATRGHESAPWSEWSPTSTIQVIAAPTVTITSPGATWPSNKLAVTWVTSQAAGLPQSSWTATLKWGGALLVPLFGNGATTKATFVNVDLINGETYSVEVSATVLGVKVTKIQTFTVAFTKPAAPTLSVVWDDDAGYHLITAAPGSGSSVATTSLILERSLDGEAWQTLLSDFTTLTRVSDVEGRSSGPTWYRLIAVGANTATHDTVVEALASSDAIWVGDGTSETPQAPLRFDVKWRVSYKKAHSDLVWLDGDKDLTVVEDTPISVEESLSVSGSILPEWLNDHDSERDLAAKAAMVTLFRESSIVQVRCPDGYVIRGSIRDLDYDSADPLGSASLTVVRAT